MRNIPRLLAGPFLAVILGVVLSGCGSDTVSNEQACAELRSDIAQATRDALSQVNNPEAAANAYKKAADKIRSHSNGANDEVVNAAQEVATTLENLANRAASSNPQLADAARSVADAGRKLNAACS